MFAVIAIAFSVFFSVFDFYFRYTDFNLSPKNYKSLNIEEKNLLPADTYGMKSHMHVHMYINNIIKALGESRKSNHKSNNNSTMVEVWGYFKIKEKDFLSKNQWKDVSEEVFKQKENIYLKKPVCSFYSLDPVTSHIFKLFFVSDLYRNIITDFLMTFIYSEILDTDVSNTDITDSFVYRKQNNKLAPWQESLIFALDRNLSFDINNTNSPCRLIFNPWDRFSKKYFLKNYKKYRDIRIYEIKNFSSSSCNKNILMLDFKRQEGYLWLSICLN